MAIERQTQAWPLYPVEPWPTDDTEESVLGTDLHQTTIVNIRLGINMAARMGLRPEEPSPWRALIQLEYLGCRRPDGSSLRTYPDIFVFRHAIDPLRGSFSLQIDGPPVLIVEVLSESTYKSDINLERGKGFSYEHLGAPEYLVLDPTCAMLREGILGWRLDGEIYRPWEPAPDGRRYSDQIPLAISMEGALARVYLRDGSPLLREEEIADALAQKDVNLARRDADLSREREERVKDREELDRLRRLLAERE
jgi:hypothetical protein